MMRSKLKWIRLAMKPLKSRNFVAVLISFSAISVLLFNFDPTPAGGDIGEEVVDLDAITADIDVPTGNMGGTSANGANSGNRPVNSLEGNTALLMNLMLMDRGIKKLEKLDSYTATFYKKEFVNGKMLDAQVMKLKMRHEPFSVYMKWEVGDKGRELLYVKGEQNGDMLIKLGGVKRLIPTLKLNPKGATAMEESRHPVTEMGLLQLSKLIASYRKSDISKKSGVTCRMFDNQKINDQACYCFIVEYGSEKVNEDYRKSVVFVDKKTSFPICVKNFGWPGSDDDATGKELDKLTLVEDYRYTGIRMDRQLVQVDFSRKNSKYRLRR
jgi:hypothetical protein